MPLFSSHRPSSITSSIRAMLNSSPNLSEMDKANADEVVARTGQHNAMAEHARAQAQAIWDAQAAEKADRTFRQDPGNAIDYASTVSGAPLAQVKQWDDARRGVVRPPATPNDDEGNAMPAAVSVDPGINAQVMDQIKAALGSIGATRFATKPSDAAEMTKAGENLLQNSIRAAATNPDLNPAQRVANSEALTGKVVEPFKETASGAQTLNTMTGDTADTATDTGKLARAAVAALVGAREGQEAASRAHAGLSAAQTQKVRSEGAAGAAAGTGEPAAALPGSAGTKVLQQADTGDKFAYNEKSGKAWKATPDGWQPIAINDLPKNVSKIGAGGATQGNREAVFTQRVVTSANQAAKDLANVVQLPLMASTGILGGRKQGPGLFDAGREVLANKMTGQEAQSYNAMATGFQRSLAAIESAGLMPSGSLTHQMDAVLFKEGDTNLTKLHKLAQTRQIIESGLEVLDANPRVSEPEKAKIKSVIASVEKAVPFTHSDLIELDKAQAINPKTTINDVVKARSGAAPAADRRQSPRTAPSSVMDEADAIISGKRK